MKIIKSIKNRNSENNSNDFQEEESLSLHDILMILQQNAVIIGITVIVFLTTAIFYAYLQPDIYQSTTALKISKPQSDILSGSLLPELSDITTDRFIATEIEILQSRELREKVIKTIIDTFNTSSNKNNFSVILDKNLFSNGHDHQLLKSSKISKKLTDIVTIEQKKGVDIIEISAESSSPSEAKLIANAYASAYKETNLNINRQTLREIKDFLKGQKDDKLIQLAGVEDNFRRFQEQKGIIQLDAQSKALIEQMSDAETKLNECNIELAISAKSLTQLKDELAKQDPNIKDYIESFKTEPYIKNLQAQIADLQSQKDRSLSVTGSNKIKTEIIKDFDYKINELNEKLNKQMNVFKTGVLAATPIEIKELTKRVLDEEIKFQSTEASANKIKEIVKQYEGKFNQLPKSTIEIVRLQREKDSNEKIYTMIEEKYQEAIITEQSQPGNVFVIDHGIVPEFPFKPNRILIMLVGLFMGAMIGAAIAFVRNHFDTSVKTPEDIENLNIPVLSFIPKLKEVVSRNTEKEFVVANKSDDKVSESFKSLRTRLKFLHAEEKIKTILITSPIAQEGKSFVAVNLATSFAQDNLRTVIVDADLRKPRVHSMFKVKKVPGLSDYLFEIVDYSDIIQQSSIENLSFITSGKLPSSPTEVLGSKHFQRFIDKLSNEFDMVIIDSPPVIAVTDAEILARLVDVSLLVVKADSTDIRLLEKAAISLTFVDTSFAGTILNQFAYRNGYGSYYKYYHYYYGPSTDKQKVIKFPGRN